MGDSTLLVLLLHILSLHAGALCFPLVLHSFLLSLWLVAAIPRF